MAPNIIPSCCLTAEQKDSLIDAVLERPVIWDCSLPDYQDVQNRRAAFAEVALLLSDGKSQYTGPEMQVEWKKLRDIFNRTLKKVVANGGSDSEVTWRFWQKLQFIADHERSQIFKAMQKWSKKVPSSNSPPAKRRSVATSHSTSCQVSSRRPKTEPRRFSPANDDSPAPPPSMVQQLADVAQSARELLGMEEEDETELTKEQEEEEPSNSECSREIDTARLDPLGQLLLLSSQMQNSPAMGAEQASTMLDSAVAGMVKMENGSAAADFPKLLNEWLTKGAAAVPTVSTSNAADSHQGGRKKIANSIVTAAVNGGTKRSRQTTMDGGEGADGSAVVVQHQQQQQSRGRQATDAGGGGGWAQQQTGSDQFDIFGMFIASQVRTLHSQSPQSALRLKRALTDMCFKFEAEQEQDE